MASIIEYDRTMWIDLKAPTKEEIDQLGKRFNLNSFVATELLKPTFHPKVDVYDDFLYLVLYFPFFDEESQTSRGQEIDFILGKNFVITVHYEQIQPIRDLISGNKNNDHHKKLIGNHSGHAFSNILQTLYAFSIRELDHIQKKIDAAENKIFNGHERAMVRTLSLLRRDVLNFRRALHTHRGIFDSLKATGEKFFEKDFGGYLRKMEGEFFRIWNILENSRETVEALRETNDSLLVNKTNEVMKFLTIIAFITFSLTLTASIFGMNAKATPIIGMNNDFWIIMAIMSGIILTIFALLKIKRWI